MSRYPRTARRPCCLCAAIADLRPRLHRLRPRPRRRRRSRDRRRGRRRAERRRATVRRSQPPVGGATTTGIGAPPAERRRPSAASERCPRARTRVEATPSDSGWAPLGTSAHDPRVPLPRRRRRARGASPPVASRGRTCTSSRYRHARHRRRSTSALICATTRFLGAFITRRSCCSCSACAPAVLRPGRAARRALKSYWLVIHVFVAIARRRRCSPSAFALSGLQLLQARRERQRPPEVAAVSGPVPRTLPGSDALETLAYRFASSASSSGPSRSSPVPSGPTRRGAATGAGTPKRSGPSSSGCSTPATSTRGPPAAGAAPGRRGLRSSASPPCCSTSHRERVLQGTRTRTRDSDAPLRTVGTRENRRPRCRGRNSFRTGPGIGFCATSGVTHRCSRSSSVPFRASLPRNSASRGSDTPGLPPDLRAPGDL